MLGHELFHALHAHLLLHPARWYDQVKEKKVKIVVESLATCFEFLLCERLGLDAKRIVLNKLFDGELPEYPYAGARGIICRASFGECGEIFSVSLRDFVKGYEVIKKQ